jgi:hypothetical protein
MLTLLCVAACVTPSPNGHGSHLALGMPPCGWVISFGKPCPTCGMTTSFALATHGHLLDAVVNQPFGGLLALACGVAFWGAVHVGVTGSRLADAAATLTRPRVVWSLVALLAVSWLYKLAIWTP